MRDTIVNRRHALSFGALSAATILLPSVIGRPASATGAAAMVSVGSIRATTVMDHSADLSSSDLLLSTGAPAPALSDLASPVVANILRFKGRNVLVGTGSGGRLGARSQLIEGLAVLGMSAADINLILLTHLHPEHVGGLIAADGSAVFPNATVVSCRTEWRWWNTSDRPAGLPERYLPFVALARAATRPYEQAGRLVTFSGTEVVAEGITGFPALGHTAGHSLYLLQDGGSTVLTLGDVVHAVRLQVANPGISTRLDIDPTLSANTRRSILADAADKKYVVVGNHFDAPGVARVVRKGSGFEFAPM